MSKSISKKEYNKRIKFFKERVSFYQNLFGLISYEIDVLPQVKDGVEGSMYGEYNVLTDTQHRVTIAYTISYLSNIETTYNDIDKTAFHEVLEVLFNDVRCLMETVYSESFVDRKIHCLIRTFENVKEKMKYINRK